MRVLSSCCRLSWFSQSSSSNQLAMRTMSFPLGLRGLGGSSPWPPSSGFLCVPFTHCGCYLVHFCRWHMFDVCPIPCWRLWIVPVCLCHPYKESACFNYQWYIIIVLGFFFLQKLKLSLRPGALDGKSKMAYYERGGNHGDLGISVISFNNLPEKTPTESTLGQNWDISVLIMLSYYSLSHLRWQALSEIMVIRNQIKVLKSNLCFIKIFAGLWRGAAKYLPCRYIRFGHFCEPVHLICEIFFF